MRTAELHDLTFRCLEGCGFCCTFQPEVSRLELGRLRQRLAPAPVPVTVGGDGRSYLRLQGGCGACTLNERRGCTVYDIRPQHCRYFPFHVHFAEEPEIYVNYTCRGVERAPGAHLQAEYDESVTANAAKSAFDEHVEDARAAYAEFRRLAKRADAWGDADAAVAKLLAEGPALFTGETLARMADAADLDPDLDALHAEALQPFGYEEVARRPFYLAPDLKWYTFARAGDDALEVLEMDEAGALHPRGRIDGVGRWAAPEPALAQALFEYVRRLTVRRVFVGQAYALVDDDRYETSVEEAVHARFVEVVCDLALRARILRGLGTAEADLPEECARFYDSTFLDTPTIGGFL